MVKQRSSAVYECRVMHHRLTPKVHHFNYRVFYLWLDLDELDVLDRELRLFGRNRARIFSFHDKDHLDLGYPDVKQNLLHWIENQGEPTADIASVKLLTFPRVFGYIFNPVCFFFCFNARGEALHAVSQVTNTFRELKPYLISGQDESGRFRRLVPKHFYVSPFSDLEVCFDFKLRIPGEHLDIHIDDKQGEQVLLLSSLSGTRKPLSDARFLWFTFKYPLLTLKVIFLIHWHAALLWMRRLPFHRKASNAHLQRDVMKPHRSITTQSPPP